MHCLTSLTFDLPVLVVSALLAALSAMRIWVWQRRRFPGKRVFIVAYYAMLWWLFAAGMELASTELSCKIFWAQMAWPAITLLPTAWAVFLYDYSTGSDEGSSGRRRTLLYLGPVLIGLMAMTNGWHHLFYGSETELVEIDGRLSGAYAHGPLFYFGVVYDYVFMLASVIIGLSALWGVSPAFRSFFAVLLGMTVGPIIGNLAYVIAGFTLFGFDPTPFMFALVLAAFGWLVFNNRMMDVNGIARDILFYNSEDPILITDPDRILVGYNPAALRVFGASLPEIGAPLDDLAELAPTLRRLRDPETTHSVAPLISGERAFDPRLRPIINPLAPNRSSLGWLLTLVDITEQQRAATSLRLAADRAREASQAKTQFVSTVSHELRTPLTSIKGALALLNSPMFNDMKPEARRILEIAANNSNRLHALIDDLLDLNRIEAGAMTFQRAPVDLAALLRDAAEANEGYGHSFSVSLSLTPMPGPLYIDGDQARLMQVLANVLSNAFKFSQPGGIVTVTLERLGDMARISIHDDGIGIPEGSKDKVFGAFTQLDSSDTRKRSGSGLGMSITRRIVEMHEGQIDYVSAPGNGTTFFIDLPLMANSPA